VESLLLRWFFYKVPFHPTVFLVAPLCSRSDIIGQTDSLQSGTHASGQTGYHCTRLTHLGSDGWGLLLCTVGKFTRRPLAFTQAWLMRSLAGSLSFGPCNNFLLYNIAVGPLLCGSPNQGLHIVILHRSPMDLWDTPLATNI